MIKIGQIQGWFNSGQYIFKNKKNLKKIGIQANNLESYLRINNSKEKWYIGNTNMIQFDNLNEELTISIINKKGNTTFIIVDYEERIDE